MIGNKKHIAIFVGIGLVATAIWWFFFRETTNSAARNGRTFNQGDRRMRVNEVPKDSSRVRVRDISDTVVVPNSLGPDDEINPDLIVTTADGTQVYDNSMGNKLKTAFGIKP